MLPAGPLFGQIHLQCGPGGPADEGGLTFTAGRLNVFIGPNNAGKSLALRELGGRAEEQYRRYERPRLPGRLIRAVGYSPACEDEVGENVKQSVLQEGDEVHGALRGLRWRELMRCLEERQTASLETIRSLIEKVQASLPLDQLPAGLRNLVTQGLASGVLDNLIPLGLAMITGPHGAPQYRDAARVLLNPAIQEGCAVLEVLGLDLSDIRGLRAEEAAPRLEADLNMMVGSVVRGTSDPPSLNWQRLLKLAPWALETNKWRDLRHRLEAEYQQRTWGHHNTPEDLKESVLVLNGATRLTLTKSSYNREYAPDKSDSAALVLLDRPEVAAPLRRLVHDALQAWLVVDMVTEGSTVHLRLAKEEPAPGLEQRRDAETMRYMKSAERLNERSDGINAYIGLLAAILTSPARLVFIDEPETFLHPALARILGRQLAELARERDLQVFIATHSPDLLAGCVAGDPEARIVRLTYKGERGRAWLIDPQTLRRFATDPRLRTASALEGLFAEAVIITEGFADRAFYQEIYERLCQAPPPLGLPRRAEGWCFVNLENWQTETLLLEPLRRLGIPAVAVVDRDVLFAQEANARRLLIAAGVPEAQADEWRTKLSALKRAKQQDSPEVEEIRRAMAKYGHFVVPVGELEDWLETEIPKKKTDWLGRAFDCLGSDPAQPGYRLPESGGVWDFLREIAAWIDDSARLGCG
jgi:hypothetical protein